MSRIEWRSEAELRVKDTGFTLAPTNPYVGAGAESGPRGVFVLRKPRWMVECYERVCNEVRPAKVVELGIDRGGSTALFALLFEPTRMVSLDVSPERVETLDELVVEHALQDHVHAYFGVDQADEARLRQIIDAEFGSMPLDLVVDDASHRYRETVTSFNVLFPRLRPG